MHGWSANIAVGLVILAAFFAARQKTGSNDPHAREWAWSYGLVAAAMVVAAIVVKGGDRIGLFSEWEWLDAHATFVVEAILIALIGVFWVLQTIDRREQGAPSY